MPSSRLRFVLAAIPAIPLLAVACSSSTSKGPKGGGDGSEWAGETRDVTIAHEPCDPAGKQVQTYKGESNLASGKSFVTHVYDGGREVCSFADLNGDGNVDVFRYFGPDGRLRRVESAFTHSKAIDEIAVYEGGEISVVMRETNFDGKLDTWDYYQGGKLVRRERDKDGDGRLDEWWTFEPGTDNATIVQADSRTGKPDPTQTIKLGGGASVGGGLGATKPATPAADAGAPAPSEAPATDGTYGDAGAADASSTADKGQKGTK